MHPSHQVRQSCCFFTTSSVRCFFTVRPPAGGRARSTRRPSGSAASSPLVCCFFTTRPPPCSASRDHAVKKTLAVTGEESTHFSSMPTSSILPPSRSSKQGRKKSYLPFSSMPWDAAWALRHRSTYGHPITAAVGAIGRP
jgi:hypothetical protein